MTPKEKASKEKKLCKLLRKFTSRELKELGINGQQNSRIHRGEIVIFRVATIERLWKTFRLA